jgi:hypothetical protein
VPAQPSGDALALEGTFRGEREAPGKVRWSLTEEGYRVEVSCEGAEAVGLQVDLASAHLSGAVNVIGSFSPQPLPAVAGQRMAEVAQVLAGDPKSSGGRPATLVTLLTEGAKPVATVEFVPTADPAMARLLTWLPGASGSLDVVTSFSLQAKRAEAMMAEARAALEKRPGVAIKMLRDVAAQFPFDQRIGDVSRRLADEREAKVLADVEALDQALQRYRIYRSRDALETLESRAQALEAQFLGSEPLNPETAAALELRIEALVREAAQERRDFDGANALPEVMRLERIAEMLAGDEGMQPLAALFSRAILSRFGAWAEEDSDIGRRVKAARARLEQLQASESVSRALPPEPESSRASEEGR